MLNANFESILDSIPVSKRAYFVRKQTTRPSGFGRTCPIVLEKPLYYVMRRPVDNYGRKSDFYGTKIKQFRGPFLDRSEAEQKAQSYNQEFHVKFAS